MKGIWLIYFVLCGSLLWSQQRDLQAVRITEKLTIDGQLSENSWKSAWGSEDFYQYEPQAGEPSTQHTQIKVLYDDIGIYIGMIMNDDQPDQILKEYSPRDVIGNVDWCGVIIDPYRSGINAYGFIVSAVGVQRDLVYTNDIEDSNWDAVWESAVELTEKGWVAELKIPYSAIRFSNAKIQEWNIQFVREIRRLRETSYWNPVNIDIQGLMNQSGRLYGISGINSPTRLSINPYIAGYVQHLYNFKESINETAPSYSVGMDVKYGINDAFTLDMALVPDFGQTISDDQILNLTPFEVYFQENRPFFTEGIELFNKGGLFYSRRVGSQPIGFSDVYLQAESDEIVVDNPSQAQILNATKVSGRTNGGTGIGFFNAITGREYATIQSLVTGDKRRILTSPVTNYNVLVVDQNLRNNSSISLINTHVYREGAFKKANVTGVFTSLKTGSQVYGLDASMVISNQYGDHSGSVGHAYGFEGGKISGPFRAIAYANVESDKYQINDVGFLSNNNEKTIGVVGEYVNNRPKADHINRYNIYLSSEVGRLFKPDNHSYTKHEIGGFLLGKNRFGYRFIVTYLPKGMKDYFEPRTLSLDQFYHLPSSLKWYAYVSTDYRKTFAIDADVSYTGYGDKRYIWGTYLQPRVRINNKFTIIGLASISLRDREEGYVPIYSDIDYPIDMHSNDILMGSRTRKIIESALELRYIINNKSSFNIRCRHYYDRVAYTAFGLLNEQGKLDYFDYDGEDNDHLKRYDNEVQFFNIDMNYIWRFAPGSDFIINWKNAISSRSNELNQDYFNSFVRVFDQTQRNVISLKLIYYLDYNQVIN